MMSIEDHDSQVEPDEELTDPLQSWEMAADDALLLEVARAVYKKRDEQYGQSYQHHSDTARMWSVYLGFHVNPEQVSAMFILDKIVRSKTEDKPDHWIDVAGYAQVHTSVQAKKQEVTRLVAEFKAKVVQDND